MRSKKTVGERVHTHFYVNPLVSGQNIMKSEKEDPNIDEYGVEAFHSAIVYSSKVERFCHKTAVFDER